MRLVSRFQYHTSELSIAEHTASVPPLLPVQSQLHPPLCLSETEPVIQVAQRFEDGIVMNIHPLEVPQAPSIFSPPPSLTETKAPPHFPQTPERIPHQLGIVELPVIVKILEISSVGICEPVYTCWIAVTRFVIPEEVSSTGSEVPEKTWTGVKAIQESVGWLLYKKVPERVVISRMEPEDPLEVRIDGVATR